MPVLQTYRREGKVLRARVRALFVGRGGVETLNESVASAVAVFVLILLFCH